jgi:hypothetical protein
VGIFGSASAGRRGNEFLFTIYGKGRKLSMGLNLILKGEFPISREFFPSTVIGPGLFKAAA